MTLVDDKNITHAYITKPTQLPAHIYIHASITYGVSVFPCEQTGKYVVEIFEV